MLQTTSQFDTISLAEKEEVRLKYTDLAKLIHLFFIFNSLQKFFNMQDANLSFEIQQQMDQLTDKYLLD